MAELHEMVMEEALKGVEPMPGARELLDRLDGVPVGVASNSPRSFVERTLEAAGLRERLRLRPERRRRRAPQAGAGRLRRARAGPGRRSRGLRGAGGLPDRVAAARAAGAFVIGVPSLDGVVLDEADLVADTLADPRVLARLA